MALGRWRLPGDPAHDYQVLRRNEVWPDHVRRVAKTGEVIAALDFVTVADPACGDGSILADAYRRRSFMLAYLNDLSLPNISQLDVPMPYQATCGDALSFLLTVPPVDLMVMTEILEHASAPEFLLRAARRVSDLLVASSPLNEGEGNPEHLWGFTADGYRDMLRQSGWEPLDMTVVDNFQIHVCR
jgi:hypothetical protein